MVDLLNDKVYSCGCILSTREVYLVLFPETIPTTEPFY